MSTCNRLAATLLTALLATAPGLADEGSWSSSRSISKTKGNSSWIGVWLVDEVDGGARVIALVPGGPAESSNLQVGDIIVRANGEPVPEQEKLTGVLRTLEPGAPLELLVLREGTTLERLLRVAARPSRAGVSSVGFRVARRGLDLEVSEITPALREHYGAPAAAGVLVVRAEADGVGARAGIRVGDILVRVADQPIVSSRQINWVFWQPDPDHPLEAQIVREGKMQSLRLTALETTVEEAQDGEVHRRVEREAMAKRLKLELERLERRMTEIQRELQRLDADAVDED